MSESDEGFIGNKYSVESKKVKSGGDAWDTLSISVSQESSGAKVKVGSYARNYPSLYSTFHPFVSKGKELALYSSHYMYTRVMVLPECKDLGGEDKDSVDYKDHFCPVEFLVPHYRKITYPADKDGGELESWLKGDECFEDKYNNGKNILGPIQYCDFGLVAGCAWGDDSTWKIQFLDLSEADKGIINRDDRLGYVELPFNVNLKDAIDVNAWEPGHPWLGVTHTSWINYKEKNNST